MAFKQQFETRITASRPHPPGSEYAISVGIEDWNGESIMVTKIRMVYQGKIRGRKAPSFPIGTDDFERVAEEVRKLLHSKR